MDFSELVTVDVKQLMKGNKQVLLFHADKAYLLSITRRGKLILTRAEPSSRVTFPSF
ncbi:MAG: hemin uptake protein HemP [Cocleimonas sp.]|nr:hemin uptake protein HemP [Cocleimonas sp.]